MKYTLLITQQCNLSCKYCYISKKPATMSLSIAKRIVDFIFNRTPLKEKINIGFFGGEPLLELERIQTITNLIKSHPSFDSNRVEISIVTNGTIFSDKIADFINKHDIGFVISCDGPQFVHDLFRCYSNGRGTSDIVEKNILKAVDSFSLVPVNAVYHPQTLQHLPETVEYLSSLGVRQIYLNPDFSAYWRKEEIDRLPDIYGKVAEQYISFYLQETPHYISLFDSKIAVILRGGYDEFERCRMGKGEFAFTPDGRIYPCERLVGIHENKHLIGNINDGIDDELLSCHIKSGNSINTECMSCGLKDFCMHWCGCSNYFSTGYYNRVSPFLCASEKTALQISFNIFKILEEKIGSTFFEHLGGFPIMNSNIT